MSDASVHEGSPRTDLEPFSIVRKCEPSFDRSQLSLKDVDNTESVYSRRLIRLVDDQLPPLPTVRTGVEQMGSDVVPWELDMLYKYRQDWKPSGYGLGNLVYTMSLLPNEELTLEVKTWETDKRLEELEKGVDTKNTSDVQTTASMSSQVTDQVSIKDHTYVDASLSYGGFGINASVKAGWSQDTSTMNEQIAKSGRQQMEQATSEQRSSHKVKMAISRESGSESKTTRKIRNINQAHTLNANFFEVLQEHTVTMHLYDVTFVFLGKRVLVNQPASSPPIGGDQHGFPSLVDSRESMTWGELISGVKDAVWVRRFTDVYGISPIAVLSWAWAEDLLEGAIGAPHWSQEDAAAKTARQNFQNTMLSHVQPGGWVEADANGTFRWSYGVMAGHETELVSYVYTQAGAFKSETDLNAHVKRLITMLSEAREHLGPIGESGRSSEYTVTTPTLGIYADLSLGACSGAEDYIEVNRQFDLEKKQLEIELLRAKLENAKLQNALVGKMPPQKIEVTADTHGDVDLCLDLGRPAGVDQSIAITSAQSP